MKTKLPVPIAFLVCIMSLMIISCKKKCAMPDPGITASDYATFPYTGNESIKFIHNQKDTIRFKNTGLADSSHTYNSSSDCVPNKERYHSCSFISSDSKYNLRVVLAKISTNASLNFRFIDSTYGCYIPLLTNSSNYADTIIIQGKMHTKVKKILDVNNIAERSRFILYNISEGVLRIQNGTNDTWDLYSN